MGLPFRLTYDLHVRSHVFYMVDGSSEAPVGYTVFISPRHQKRSPRLGPDPLLHPYMVLHVPFSFLLPRPETGKCQGVPVRRAGRAPPASSPLCPGHSDNRAERMRRSQNPWNRDSDCFSDIEVAEREDLS